MEAVFYNIQPYPGLPLKKVMESFFAKHSPDSARYMFWKFFQCWALKDCQVKAEISDEEVAQFFDQLTELVVAAYLEHQSINFNKQKGDRHE
ncbi:hypothetical protein DIU31_028275 [Mucilaginibacter rubeus]|uniref:Uncharacterized protein n=1 Tax=Mucilaginibacter rubeus TaxID=2027860 RepID=A0AAE6MKZ0_9SPHI|nr:MULTISPECIES: hypothetical protein [Mucilaginibacter]QEM07205.1 hypothetical protein DIU31_028275 [Mucilaginibacter rubeus]QEM19661.1 hypothetical protein DIU38_027850 [Mucilaginibacter gossypii]QTE43643.1 hypothetical protein J3L19_32780 [Mucilaginibacter rubeus]QTE50243.1 hypothetical protein J3L21_32735 [Mucilaginibacter rubeus]QTE55331.1 hypothetical protein J3L23_24355 [Mucilaginibacter rubeus]